MAKKTEPIPVAQVAPPPTGGKPKTVCPLTHEQFMTKAPVLKIRLDEGDAAAPVASFLAGPRRFSTGSIGYNVSGKMTLIIDGKAVEFQVGMNITAIGSKPAN